MGGGCDQCDQGTGVGGGGTVEEHFLESWFDPYTGIEVGLLYFSLKGGRYYDTFERAAFDVAAKAGIDLHIRSVAFGPTFAAHLSFPEVPELVMSRATLIPMLRVSVQVD